VKQRRVFISDSEITGNGITFSPGNSRYLASVLRLRTGDPVLAFHGNRRYAVRITGVSSGRVSAHVECVEPVSVVAGPEVHLAVACIRPGPFEEVLRHGTELGVTRFIPIQSARTTREPPAKKNRWQLIIESAAAQCGRSTLPNVEDPFPFHVFLEEDARVVLRAILCPHGNSEPLLTVLEEQAPTRIVFLIGPEGGFEPLEEQAATRRGFIPVSFGPLILKAETAAIAAVSTVVAWNEWRRCLSAEHSE
jgi:16S rRNA (uracil1498-N3)-methyltransferase